MRRSVAMRLAGYYLRRRKIVINQISLKSVDSKGKGILMSTNESETVRSLQSPSRQESVAWMRLSPNV